MSRIGFDRFAPAVLLVWILALAWCFAHAEIQIEGGAGWAANLPTWRVERRSFWSQLFPARQRVSQDQPYSKN